MPIIKQAIELRSPLVHSVNFTTFTGPTSLPMHPDLDLQTQRRVANAVIEACT